MFLVWNLIDCHFKLCNLFVISYLIMLLTFRQVLNEYFHNVCELDLVFNFYKVSTKLPTVLTHTNDERY